MPKIFVGRIGHKVNEEDLRKLFEGIGKMLEVKILRGHDGKSRGCGFIQFSSIEESKNAISVFDGKYKFPVRM